MKCSSVSVNKTLLTPASPSIPEHHLHMHHSELIPVCASVFPVLPSLFELVHVWLDMNVCETMMPLNFSSIS